MEETSSKVKIYYQKSTGYVCYRYPNDYMPNSEDDFIELTDEEAEPTYQCPYGKIWVVRDGTVVMVDDEKLQSTQEYRLRILEDEQISLQKYLSDTDYVITKLNELKLEDEEEYEAEKVKYFEVLAKRKAARKRIREIDEELKSFSSSSDEPSAS